MATVLDQDARHRAATATDRNIVVTAGAGTGKTTLLVDRLIHLLLNRPDPLEIGQIVALTFTNKAASEMKLRLRDRLIGLREHKLARQAVAHLEKSQIGTIHSFAAHLLRLHPIESGVDPAFQQDEGDRFKEYFDREWALWLDVELGGGGTHHEVWREALRTFQLEDLKTFASRLAGELIPLDQPIEALDGTELPVAIRSWLAELSLRAGALREAHPKANTLELMLEEASLYLQREAEGRAQDREARAALEKLDREPPAITKAWTEEDHGEAVRILKVARACGKTSSGVLRPLLQLFLPFAKRCRNGFLQTGYVSFDGLLAWARNLLRDHPLIRRYLKSQFRSILVDEFQDTDPVQYEMILYLAEAPGQEATDWRQVRLEPGKLFIVGDPKQSIYAFRRADMEAYDTVVEDRVLAQSQQGERHTLQTNFRSHHRLIATVNALFGRIFPGTPIKGLQPQHDPLLPYEPGARLLSHERIEVRLVKPEEPDADADTASRAEAEELARWLSEEVLGREEIMEGNVPVKIKPGHVAILFRALTTMREYLEAFRRFDIPCLTEGEKHFYERQEIIDAVNLLRAMANPHDRLALAGVLRSCLGGVTDREIETLARGNLLDYRIAGDKPAREEAIGRAFDAVSPLYGVLRSLRQELPRLPLTDVMDEVMANVPLIELATASLDREQAAANLFKLRDMMSELAKRPSLTFHGLVEELTERAISLPEETESSLTEELSDESEQQGAVRLLSIHKAKGLEFPVVILAGLHRGTDRREPRILVQHDWSSGVLGLRLGDLQTFGGLYVSSKLAQRQRAEQSRILYVAMTRAKRRLILSAGLPKKPAGDSFLSLITERLALDIEALGADAEARVIPVGEGQMHVHLLEGPSVPRQGQRQRAQCWAESHDDVSRVENRWDKRLQRRDEAIQRPLFVSPTGLQARRNMEEPVRRHPPSEREPDEARLIGTLAHRVLEGWDYREDPKKLDDRVVAVCQRAIFPEGVRGADLIEAELRRVFARFIGSDAYCRLAQATIIGQEVPFSIPWEGDQIVSGVMDLLYRLDGKLWIADYKTDAVPVEGVPARVEHYREQAAIYRKAVEMTTGEAVAGCNLIFLRPGLVMAI